MTIGDTIMKALNVIRTNGWTKHIRHDERGRVCALGAVESALDIRDYFASSNREFVQTVAALVRYLPPVEDWKQKLPESARVCLTPGPGYVLNNCDEVLVALYNNYHTQQEVEDWFEKAARNEGLTG
jgi:hypothetical protein